MEFINGANIFSFTSENLFVIMMESLPKRLSSIFLWFVGRLPNKPLYHSKENNQNECTGP